MPELRQDLEIFAKDDVLDGVTGVFQKEIIQDNLWASGWTRNQVFAIQELNTLLYLLTTYASPSPLAPTLWPTSATVPTLALELDGRTITEQDYPNAYNLYGATLPDLTADAPTGFTYIIRGS